MCAVFGRHLDVNEKITTMCISCKLSCQHMEDKSRSTKGDFSEQQTRPRRTPRKHISYNTELCTNF